MSGIVAASPYLLDGRQPSAGRVRPAGDDDAGEAGSAARDLEAFFLRQLLAEIRPEGDALDGGFAGSTFREMLDGAMADKMAESGGIGLAAMIQPELERASGLERPGRSAESATPHGRAAAAYRATTRYLPAEDPGMPELPGSPLRAVPVVGEKTSGFGRRIDPIDGDVRTHAGLDLAAPEGTAVRAAGDGVVVRSGRAGGYGNLVVVDHGGGLQTRYGHLARIDVEPGARVAAGTPVGAVGQTGRATGPHLHFEVRRDGKAVDPEKIEEKRTAPLNPGAMRSNRTRGGR